MTIDGTQTADAVYLVKNGAASCASVQVTNAATGKQVTWANTLEADEWLRLDSANQRAEVSGDDGDTWVRRNGGMLGEIPKVVGGSDNAITFTGPTTGTVNVTYTARG